TRGRQSGTVRKVALMRVEHDGEYAVIGSQGGAPQHPAWVHNLRTAPEEVALQDGPEPFAARAREVEGDERARWWERAVAAYPPYADSQTTTARHIPVFVITPTTGGLFSGRWGHMLVPPLSAPPLRRALTGRSMSS